MKKAKKILRIIAGIFSLMLLVYELYLAGIIQAVYPDFLNIKYFSNAEKITLLKEFAPVAVAISCCLIILSESKYYSFSFLLLFSISSLMPVAAIILLSASSDYKSISYYLLMSASLFAISEFIMQYIKISKAKYQFQFILLFIGISSSILTIIFYFRFPLISVLLLIYFGWIYFLPQFIIIIDRRARKMKSIPIFIILAISSALSLLSLCAITFNAELSVIVCSFSSLVFFIIAEILIFFEYLKEKNVKKI